MTKRPHVFWIVVISAALCVAAVWVFSLTEQTFNVKGEVLATWNKVTGNVYVLKYEGNGGGRWYWEKLTRGYTKPYVLFTK